MSKLNTQIKYSDFLNDFMVHPDNAELVRATNETSVKRAIRNLIRTDKYERVFQPEIGCNIRKRLFEPMSSVMAGQIRDDIKNTLENFEPRINVLEVIVTPFEDKNLYDVTIVFTVINTQETTSLQLKLYRVR